MDTREIVEKFAEKNGHARVEPAVDAVHTPRLSPQSLRRLFRLQAKLDGATVVAQAAVDAQQTVRREYEQMFRDMCEDYGIDIPAGPHTVDINWSSGEVLFLPEVGP
jgi:hypothetical protein